MKVFKLVAMIPLLLMALESQGQEPVDGQKGLSRLAWIAGVWHDASGGVQFEEHWTSGDDVMVGMSRTVKEGKTVFYEYLRIEDRGEAGIFYIAKPKTAQSEAEFKMTSLGKTSVVFENSAHDFPRRITYSQTSVEEEKKITAVVDDGTDDKKLTFEFSSGRLDGQ